MTLTSLASPLAALTAGLTVFVSGFLVVTEAFDCTEADFELASDKFFFVGVTAALVTALVTSGAAARTALGAVLALDFFADAATAAVTDDFTAFTADAATLPEGLEAVVFGTDLVATELDLVTDFVAGLTTGLAAALAAGLTLIGLALGLALFVGGVGVFAVFFIAFAIESTAK
ncbi:phage shock protein PspC (stress-responsive transcriptional regulator) [Herbaspirillum sp. Sphag1AN]|uniref:hypothetical protein n=1 Tax=unclassified Herbaspirillum TaxID=2624150 RepID=UPI00179C6E55|nr:phage shock protein PspC (stress-responsive transcriptional regulator) [Herbaspirillum sp. Sphag1AN]MBB3247309.1 phage shock protein PspC (stress-responsive transcriptional regulator) [Herbaspirillum sp. Sphag64]